MVNPAPVRVARKSTMNSPLVKAANKIVTSPTFAKARSIDFDKKNEYEKFIKFIESSNQELLRIKLPRKDEVIKAGGLGDGGGGGGIIPNLLSALAGLVGGALTRPLARRIRNLIPRKYRVRLKSYGEILQDHLDNLKDLLKVYLERYRQNLQNMQMKQFRY